MARNVVKSVVGVVLIVLMAAGAFVGGMLYANVGGTIPGAGTATVSQSTELSRLVQQVRAIILTSALKPSSDESITIGAVDGMLSSLEDTYAVYYTPKEYKALQEEQAGEFYGIGVSLGLNKDGQPYAVRVFKSSPAEKAGIKQADVFTSVNGVSRDKWDLDQFASMVRGPKDTTVTLGIARKGTAPFKVTVTRDKITVPNTDTKLYGTVGYVRLMTFNERSASDVADAVKQLEAKGARSFVLDLRENPGGLLASAIDVSSLFIKDGVVVRVDERDKPEEVDRTTGLHITDAPLVVLIDGWSASASEIVAGALKDNGRATIVGVTSYGKGSVQNVQPVLSGGAVKLTIAHYLTPNGTVINGIGVKPDVTVKMDAALQKDPKTDTQLQKALEVARSKAK